MLLLLDLVDNRLCSRLGNRQPSLPACHRCNLRVSRLLNRVLNRVLFLVVSPQWHRAVLVGNLQVVLLVSRVLSLVVNHRGNRRVRLHLFQVALLHQCPFQISLVNIHLAAILMLQLNANMNSQLAGCSRVLSMILILFALAVQTFMEIA